MRPGRVRLPGVHEREVRGVSAMSDQLQDKLLSSSEISRSPCQLNIINPHVSLWLGPQVLDPVKPIPNLSSQSTNYYNDGRDLPQVTGFLRDDGNQPLEVLVFHHLLVVGTI